MCVNFQGFLSVNRFSSNIKIEKKYFFYDIESDIAIPKNVPSRPAQNANLPLLK